ncbi:hypothetical protein CAter282_0889 [Collimonas arenae]|uniref:Uncharacterized protein n=1 Tax=Collimonas arenae TaxID=279058 RepID=A0A127PMH2_9BURK|nr:hypothetical protein CAter10_0962 [Collimonas arenae]AMP08689.1 hypothetical protein CAter282_0889 [Collimonas arenae]
MALLFHLFDGRNMQTLQQKKMFGKNFPVYLAIPVHIVWIIDG